MILQYQHLSEQASVFRSLSGLSVPEFDTLYTDMQGYYVQAEWEGSVAKSCTVG